MKTIFEEARYAAYESSSPEYRILMARLLRRISNAGYEELHVALPAFRADSIEYRGITKRLAALEAAERERQDLAVLGVIFPQLSADQIAQLARVFVRLISEATKS